MRYSRYLFVFQIVLVLAAVGVSARPAARFARRTALAWRGEWIWTEWNKSGQYPKSGDPAAWLETRRLKQLILMDATEGNLHRSACWSLAGAAPGKEGLIILQGHRDTHFRDLKYLERGDDISLASIGGTEHYRVTDIEIMSPENAAHRLETERGRNSLVLMTCYPFHYFGAAPERCLVWAEPAGC